MTKLNVADEEKIRLMKMSYTMLTNEFVQGCFHWGIDPFDIDLDNWDPEIDENTYMVINPNWTKAGMIRTAGSIKKIIDALTEMGEEI